MVSRSSGEIHALLDGAGSHDKVARVGCVTFLCNSAPSRTAGGSAACERQQPARTGRPPMKHSNYMLV